MPIFRINSFRCIDFSGQIAADDDTQIFGRMPKKEEEIWNKVKYSPTYLDFLLLHKLENRWTGMVQSHPEQSTAT